MKEQKSLFASVREWDAVKAEKDAAFVRISFDWDDPAVDSIVREAAANGMRLELALRTAPGYQPDQAESKAPRLFQAAEAREPFLAFWENIAKKYAAEGDWLSFALLERPYGYWRELPDLGNAEYASVMRRAVARIRAISPSRPITLDGLDRGLNPLTDLFDLDVTQAFWPIDGCGVDGRAGAGTSAALRDVAAELMSAPEKRVERLFIGNGVADTAARVWSGGVFLTGTLLLLNADDLTIGLMSSVGAWALLFALAASWLLARARSNKKLLCLAVLLMRVLCTLPVFLAPVLGVDRRAATVLALCVLIGNVAFSIHTTGANLFMLDTLCPQTRDRFSIDACALCG